MPRSDLESLVYVSSAVRLLSPDEIGDLLKRARARNKEYDITGVLLHNNGNFVQYIEGPKDNLDIIYKIIQEDARHTGLILISREAIQSRQFGDWPLGFLTKNGEGYVDSPSEKQLIEKILELPGDNPSTAQIVLKGFWERSGSR